MNAEIVEVFYKTFVILRGGKIVLAGLVILISFTLIAILAPFITPYDLWEQDKPFLPPSGEHILGTDDIGRDIFSQLIYGTRVSLFIGLFAAFISTVVGTLVGSVAGYFRGKLDEILMGLVDIFLLIPRLPLIIILAAYLGPNVWNVVLVIGALWWPSTARVVRSRVLQVREAGFIEICKAVGANDTYILLKHVIPNSIHVVFAKFVLVTAEAILAEASLSFLGLGDPTLISWGTMLHYAFLRGGFINNMWWWYLPPGICIALNVLGFVLIGYAMENRLRNLSPHHSSS